MRVPLSWLRDFNDCELSVEELARVLTLSGLEVEVIDRIGAYSDRVVVAEIRAVKELEGTQLRVVTLKIGGAGQPSEAIAVTGAPNIDAGSVGRRVPAALAGALLVDAKSETFAISEVAEREMRGVRSTAVLCSEREIGISDEHEGVLLLEKTARVGAPISTAVEIPDDASADVVLELSILPNYGRCLSIIGVAREVSALTRTGFRLELDALPLRIAKKGGFPVEIECPDLAPRYSALVLDGVGIAPSPPWLARRLVLAGLKPINNVVDVTNYVMLEFGQPMHAFDLDDLPAQSIRVRRAVDGETMHTLDQSTEPDADGQVEPPRVLDASMPLITSGDVPVAIAGVIGGLDSEVKAKTKRILLESANFHASAIRTAMSKLKIITDAGTRFSREVDPAITVVAIRRAAALLAEVANASPQGEIADAYPEPRERRSLEVSLADIQRSLGLSVSADDAIHALSRLSFGVEEIREGCLRLDIPGFRPDVQRAADVAEEVIRILGFDRLETRRLAEPLPEARPNSSWELRRRLRSTLVGLDLIESMNYALTTPEAENRLLAAAEAGAAPAAPYVRLRNPASQERSAMRRTVLGSLLENVVTNHRTRERIALFEIGSVYHPGEDERVLPRESFRLGIVVSGPVTEATWFDNTPRAVSFFDLKSIVRAILDTLHVADSAFHPTSGTPYHPGAAAALLIDGTPVGVLGEIHPRVIEAYDLGRRKVFAAELEIEPLVVHARRDFPFRPFSRFPTVKQDLALVVDEKVPAEDVLEAIRASAGELLVGARLFDIYRGAQAGEGKKSLAFELSFCATDRSLTEEEINGVRESLLGPLGERLGAQIRT